MSVQSRGSAGSQYVTSGDFDMVRGITDRYVAKKWEQAEKWWNDVVGADKPVSWNEFITMLNDQLKNLNDEFDALNSETGLYKTLKMPTLTSGIDFGKKPGDISATLPTDIDFGDAPEWKAPDQTYTLGTLTTIPAFTVPDPVVNTNLTPPDTDLPPEPEKDFTINFPYDDMPPPLDVGTMPTPPPLTDITVPSMPPINLPVFDGVAPVISLQQIDTTFSWSEVPYTSLLNDETYTKILDLIRNGGTGLGAEVEEALWKRARDRTALTRENAYREAETYFAARGFTLPPGALSGRLLEAQQEQNRLDEQINYEIMIEQARLAQDMTKFGISSSLQMENMLRDYCNKINQRGLEAAKVTVDTAIAIFNAKIQYSNLLLDKYKTEATVFEALMRGALAAVEVYKAQIQALQLVTEIDRTRIESYKGQLQGISIQVDIYKSRLEAVKLKADIERLKLEIYRLDVEVFNVLVNAKVAQYNLYQAQIAGEKLKVELYSEQVRSYAARLDAIKTEYSAKMLELEAKVKRLEAESTAYEADVKAYNAQIEGKATEVKSLTDIYQADVSRYTAESQYLSSAVDNQVKEFLARVDVAKTDYMGTLERIKLVLSEIETEYKLQLQAIEGAMQIAANLAAASMSSLSAQAQFSTSASVGIQGQVGAQESWSHAYEEKT